MYDKWEAWAARAEISLSLPQLVAHIMTERRGRDFSIHTFLLFTHSPTLISIQCGKYESMKIKIVSSLFGSSCFVLDQSFFSSFFCVGRFASLRSLASSHYHQHHCKAKINTTFGRLNNRNEMWVEHSLTLDLSEILMCCCFLHTRRNKKKNTSRSRTSSLTMFIKRSMIFAISVFIFAISFPPIAASAHLASAERVVERRKKNLMW